LHAETVSIIDKSVQKGILHPNTAARQRQQTGAEVTRRLIGRALPPPTSSDSRSRIRPR
jgi:hypothetical protein